MGGECGEEGVGETEGLGESVWGGVWEGGGVWRAGWGEGRWAGGEGSAETGWGCHHNPVPLELKLLNT